MTASGVSVGRSSVSRRWALGLVAGMGGCVAFALLPDDSTASAAVYTATGAVAVVTLLVAAARMPASLRVLWGAVAWFAALTLVGDLLFLAQEASNGSVPRPGPVDAFYLLAYAGALTALAILVRRIHPGRDLEAWADTAILVLALATIVGEFVIVPALRDTSAEGAEVALALTYVLADLVLLSGLVRLLVGVRRVNLAIGMLCLAFATTLAADLSQSYLESHGLDSDHVRWIDALFLATFVVLAAAAWTPGARVLSPAAISSWAPTTPLRMVGLTAGALTVPTILVIDALTDQTSGARGLAVACVAVIALVLWRFRLLLSLVEGQSEQLASLARTDALTDLPNRRTLDFELERIEAETTAAGIPLTIAMLDLDHFKDFNDINGHQAGDHALIACAHAWRDTLTPPAFLARYGGEEFAVLLPGTGLATAHPLLEALRTATPHPHTVSIGYAERRPGETGFETMSRADRALYRAKQTGRDRTLTDRPATDDRVAP